MTDSQPTIAGEVERYVRTGETDPHLAAWSGGFMECAHCTHDNLRGALAHEVKRLAEGCTHEPLPQADSVALTERAVEQVSRQHDLELKMLRDRIAAADERMQLLENDLAPARAELQHWEAQVDRELSGR